jgi:hypothetical protein
VGGQAVKKDEYDEAMRLAAQSSPSWKRMPSGHRNQEKDSAKDKLRKAAGGETHKMKKNGKW